MPADVPDVDPARDVATAVGDVQVDPRDEAGPGAGPERDVRAEVELVPVMGDDVVACEARPGELGDARLPRQAGLLGRLPEGDAHLPPGVALGERVELAQGVEDLDRAPVRAVGGGLLRGFGEDQVRQRPLGDAHRLEDRRWVLLGLGLDGRLGRAVAERGGELGDRLPVAPRGVLELLDAAQQLLAVVADRLQLGERRLVRLEPLLARLLAPGGRGGGGLGRRAALGQRLLRARRARLGVGERALGGRGAPCVRVAVALGVLALAPRHVDCLARGASLGRALVYAAEHATPEDVVALRPGAEPFPPARPGRLAVRLDLPGGMLNHASIKAFNELYFRRGARRAGEPALVDWDPYFFPLDGIADWNRIYGRAGFVQYQCVIPPAAARAALGEIVERIARRGRASFLTVLKQLGDSTGTIAFARQGFTLALDLPATADVLTLLDELDGVVVEAGGRLYLAKDARQSAATFEAGYPGLPAFRELRRAVGADGRIASRLSTRLAV